MIFPRADRAASRYTLGATSDSLLGGDPARQEVSKSTAFEARHVSETTEVYSKESVASPKPFSSGVIDRLLDLLSTDDEFRELFQFDPRAALRFVGQETPAEILEIRGSDPVMCMAVVSLASKEEVKAARASLKVRLSKGPFHYSVFSA